MNRDAKRARLVAFYLPQYHPIPENDEWWGKGFTEWVTVAQARPLYRGHEQPRIPGELGFYDLRLPETRARQADLARDHGIEAFCYWHYWLGDGVQLLDRPFREVLESGQPDFPFCLGWANHSWKGVFFGAGGRTLIEQRYPGVHDFERHFRFLVKAFADERYLTVEGAPVLHIHSPRSIPDCKRVLDLWRELAHRAGLKGLHVIGADIALSERHTFGLDAVTYSRHREVETAGIEGRYSRRVFRWVRGLSPKLRVYTYEEALRYFLKPGRYAVEEYPTIVTNWDTTPRLGRDGVVFHGCTPELFRRHVREAIGRVLPKEAERRIVFVKSWNEWAEGNYLEPDRKFGRRFLEVIRDEV